MKNNIKRTFIIGDEWIYFKIYTGVKTADLILINHLDSLLNGLVTESIIDKWFFIRYSDPDFHLRLRLHVTDKSKLIDIINLINIEFNYLIELDLIWKVQIDTYNRELERYGFSFTEQSETLFYYDSKMIMNALKVFEINECPNLKWLFGLMAIDAFIDAFNLSLVEKKELMETLKINFGKEMGLDKSLKKQLRSKYEKHKFDIDSYINKKLLPEEYELITLLEIKSLSICNSIKIIKNNNINSINIGYLISSHIHMIMNRLFRTKNRRNEFVCYQMLYFYYESKIARLKYDKKYV